MLKRFTFFFLIFSFPVLIFGQSGEIIIQGASPDLYVLHTVAPKENWYSIGRLFNLSPKDIAPLNGKTLTSPLNIGDQLKVPLNNTNFSQDNAKAADEVLIPVYHVVQDKEWMYRISSTYNKVPVETLEKWNKLGKDGAKTGAHIIVGYLKVKKEQSSATAMTATPDPATSVPVAEPRKPEAGQKPETVAKQEPVKQEPVKQDPVKPEPIKQEPVKQDPPKTEVRATLPPAVSETLPQNTVVAGDSYFKNLYEPAGKSLNGVAGVFKSVSGWQDKKFYALMNNVNVGTIIKVTNPSGNKFVYAKVLGSLPEMKESMGLTIRISDAAAADLGATVTKFTVQIGY
ncbi:MAG: LysM peptidoglycan-binding domain-containing protein [Chitinophagaceae bacterium]